MMKALGASRFLFLLLSLNGSDASSQRALFDSLFANYDSRVRPQTGAENYTVFQVTPSQIFILEVDEAQQTLELNVDFIITWNDPLLKWNPAEFDGITSMSVPQTLIWKADVVVFNTITKTTLIDDKLRKVVIKNDGTVIKTEPQVIVTPCEINVKDFPFDKQKCTLDVGPWSYTKDEVHVNEQNEKFNLTDSFTGNSEWELISLKSKKLLDLTYVDEGIYEQVTYYLKMKRRSNYYIWVLIVPSFICSVLCLFGLFMPSDTTFFRIEKASLGVSTLLAMTLILDTVTSSMPKASSLPRLGKFVLFEVLICSVAVMVACIFSHVHHRATTRHWRPTGCALRLLLRRRYDRIVKQSNAVVQTGNEKKTAWSKYLTKIRHFIDETRSDERLQQIWARVFDRIDLIAMIFFQVANLIGTFITLS